MSFALNEAACTESLWVPNNVPEVPGLESLPQEAKQLFEEQGVPPYVVFSDKTLVELSEIQPTIPEEMLAITGISEVKLARYATPFLDAIAAAQGGVIGFASAGFMGFPALFFCSSACFGVLIMIH